MKRGDIFFADLDPVIGSEQGGARPVLIIQNDLGNMYSNTVITVPFTSRMKKVGLRTHVYVPLGEGGIDKNSLILCEQVRTLEKTRLTRFIGRLSTQRMLDVDKALAAAMGE